MVLTGKQKQALYNALLSAFPTRGSLSQMMVFKMDENLEKVAGGETYSDLVLSLIQWAESQGLLEKVIGGAREQNPGNRDLLAFALETGVESPPEQPEDEKEDEERASNEPRILERIVAISREDRAINIESLASLYLGARQAARAVCRIEAYQSMATGFLVAPDVVMTVYHAVQNLIEGASYVDPTTDQKTQLQPSNVAFRFGYEIVDDSNIAQEGQIRRLAPNWHVVSSPPDDLDFALLRLDGSPGHDLIKAHEQTIERGWLKTATTPRQNRGSILYILHHPSAMPLKFSSGTLLAVSDNLTRCTYDLFTAPGSTGAPCFNSEWEVLAIHERRGTGGPGLESMAQDVKSGVLVSEIVKRADVRAVLNL